MDYINEVKNKMKYIKRITKKLGHELGHYEIEDMGCPHKQPKKLQSGRSAIYIFIYKDEVLKIGKANSNSDARFTSQHYGFSTPSTLAKSLCNDEDFKPFINNCGGINKDNLKQWMLKNLRRINIYLEPDKAKTELVEAILHYAFRPRFEGNIN
ncbi:hypothetical protein [Brachyspira sp.]|uniref:hypothetical protein n=1 Tax=Brachyspira sp. TaxID=1977261 RepID=UPI003D7D3FBD